MRCFYNTPVVAVFLKIIRECFIPHNRIFRFSGRLNVIYAEIIKPVAAHIRTQGKEAARIIIVVVGDDGFFTVSDKNTHIFARYQQPKCHGLILFPIHLGRCHVSYFGFKKPDIAFSCVIPVSRIDKVAIAPNRIIPSGSSKRDTGPTRLSRWERQIHGNIHGRISSSTQRHQHRISPARSNSFQVSILKANCSCCFTYNFPVVALFRKIIGKIFIPLGFFRCFDFSQILIIYIIKGSIRIVRAEAEIAGREG